MRSEEIVFAGIEGVKAGGELVALEAGAEIGLGAGIVRGLMPRGCHGLIAGGRVVVGQVEVIEGRDGENRLGIEGVYPVGEEEGVALGLAIAEAEGLVVLRRSHCLMLRRLPWRSGGHRGGGSRRADATRSSPAAGPRGGRAREAESARWRECVACLTQ